MKVVPDITLLYIDALYELLFILGEGVYNLKQPDKCIRLVRNINSWRICGGNFQWFLIVLSQYVRFEKSLYFYQKTAENDFVFI